MVTKTKKEYIANCSSDNAAIVVLKGQERMIFHITVANEKEMLEWPVPLCCRYLRNIGT